MAYDRLRGVLVAQQKGVPAERLAGLVNGESGRRVGFESQSICSFNFDGVFSVVVANLTVNQKARVRFPKAPQTFYAPLDKLVKSSLSKGEVVHGSNPWRGTNILARRNPRRLGATGVA